MPVKVILEICCLTDEQIENASIIARDAGAECVKTSTGFGDGAATAKSQPGLLETWRQRNGSPD